MNSEKNFKSAPRLFFNKSLTTLVGMSLLLSSACVSIAAPSKPASKPKAEKSAQDKESKPEEKKDSQKDEKAGDKDKGKETADKKDGDKKEVKEAVVKPEVPIENVVNVTTDDLVDKPHEYLGKNVKFTAPFVAFSNLALDYKPAYRSSKTHISLLVSRAKKKLPLSELKIAMMTPKDEKGPETQLLSALKEGDTLEITAKVFSAALDDPWVEILRLKKIGGSTDDKKADASAKAKINDTKSGDAKNDKSNDSKGDGASKTPAKN